tara:strand:+ start:219 stop:524 length:306 start_codon:yes stop_codon:yes gene_type:complete
MPKFYAVGPAGEDPVETEIDVGDSYHHIFSKNRPDMVFSKVIRVEEYGFGHRFLDFAPHFHNYDNSGPLTGTILRQTDEGLLIILDEEGLAAFQSLAHSGD